MNIPKFTGEASLYQKHRQYRTGTQIVYSSLRNAGLIKPTVIRGEAPVVPIEVPGEEIPVHSCAPGWIDIGGTCWPAPLTEPSSGGGSGAPGGGSAGSGPGGGSGSGTPQPPRKLPRRPTIDDAGKCFYGCGGNGCGEHDCEGPICSCCYSEGCWICKQTPVGPTLCEWEPAYV